MQWHAYVYYEQQCRTKCEKSNTVKIYQVILNSEIKKPNLGGKLKEWVIFKRF